MTRFYKNIPSPVGELTLVANDTSLIAVSWNKNNTAPSARDRGSKSETHPILNLAHRQLEEYFSGIRKSFELPVQFEGTEFQNQVWRALIKIPYSKTLSYKGLAKQIGRPRACRAVGSANRRNPLGIVVPCHRVIAADGTLAGFGGGIEMKKYLLALENKISSRP